MVTLTTLITLIVGGLGGALTGGLVVYLVLTRRRVTRTRPFDAAPIDPSVDQRIRAAAAQWASANQSPGTEPLIVSKLRLVHRLNQRRMNRRAPW